ncbi:hypothetical protein SOPP22_02745 [Shewanella sp. OPT22]|nr:hypothetical protein SOPP22_02745 [Shewanella sp. OPT22]
MKNWLIILSVLSLSACSSAPKPIVLSPKVPVTNHQIIAKLPINIQVVDQRKANYLVEINGASGAERKLLSPATPPRQQLQKILIAGFNKANVSVSPQARTQLTFNLEKLLVKVKQSSFDYDATTSIVLKVKGNSSNQTFSKDYTVSGTMNGAFKLDNSAIEQELNNLIDKLTTDIINDKQLQSFISQK